MQGFGFAVEKAASPPRALQVAPEKHALQLAQSARDAQPGEQSQVPPSTLHVPCALHDFCTVQLPPASGPQQGSHTHAPPSSAEHEPPGPQSFCCEHRPSAPSTKQEAGAQLQPAPGKQVPP